MLISEVSAVFVENFTRIFCDETIEFKLMNEVISRNETFKKMKKVFI